MKRTPPGLAINFGLWVRILRTRLKLSQAAFAHLLGYQTPQAITNIERSANMVPLKRMQKFCKICNVSEQEFLTRRGAHMVAAQKKRGSRLGRPKK